MIEKLSDRLNPLKYALITIACSRGFESIEDSIKFVEEAMGRMKRYQQAVFLLRISIAEKKLRLGEHHDCKEILDTISREVEKCGDAEPKVYSMLSNVYGLYYNRKDDHENYYKSSLSYLAYTPAEDMNEAEKKQLSVKMSMSILLGKNVFNIAELLDKEVIKSLVGSDFEWLY